MKNCDMANKLDPMDLKQIITLRKDGFSNRQIGKQLGISRNTVNQYVGQFRASGKSLDELLEMDNSMLEELFPSATTIENERFNQLMRFFEKVNQAREHPGFTFLYHHKRYK
jgi:predicted transcriptional regulator